MPLTDIQIIRHPQLRAVLRRQAQAMLEAYDDNPRLGATFATQQRWLLAQLGLALYFRRGSAEASDGVTMIRFSEQARQHGIASRNTADGFIMELSKYNFIRMVRDESGGRLRWLEPTEVTLETIAGWVALHLETLDHLDGGHRVSVYATQSDGLAWVQPHIADGLLTLEAVRKPAGTFSLFTWLDKGGLIMERMIVGMEDINTDGTRVPTSVMSVSEMATWLNLSRSHLMRKLREAEALGSIGWEGRRSHSAMWVSSGFLNEMLAAQAAKLAVVDAAFNLAFKPAPPKNSAQ
tara:strand:+ start:6281 stop:7159 length:879 start_codon:yes stop_codon:yes gene_type:complete